MLDKSRVLERFMQSPFFKRMEAEVALETATLEERKARAAELARLKAERPKIMAALQAEENAARDALKAARDALKAAQSDFTITSNKRFATAWKYDQDILEASAFLYRTAPRALKDALARAKDRYEGERSRPLPAVIVPDIPEALMPPILEPDGGFSWPWAEEARRKWTPTGPTPREIRVKDLAEIQAEIDALEGRILSAEE